MAKSKGFFLYPDQYAPIAGLSLEQKGMLLEAIFAFFKAIFERDAKGASDEDEWGI